MPNPTASGASILLEILPIGTRVDPLYFMFIYWLNSDGHLSNISGYIGGFAIRMRRSSAEHDWHWNYGPSYDRFIIPIIIISSLFISNLRFRLSSFTTLYVLVPERKFSHLKLQVTISSEQVWRETTILCRRARRKLSSKRRNCNAKFPTPVSPHRPLERS